VKQDSVMLNRNILEEFHKTYNIPQQDIALCSRRGAAEGVNIRTAQNINYSRISCVTEVSPFYILYCVLFCYAV
jgi:hypothetical protein